MKEIEGIVSKEPKDYIEVALALETLAYHNKNYLSKSINDNCNLNLEIRHLLSEALDLMLNNRRRPE